MCAEVCTNEINQPWNWYKAPIVNTVLTYWKQTGSSTLKSSLIDPFNRVVAKMIPLSLEQIRRGLALGITKVIIQGC